MTRDELTKLVADAHLNAPYHYEEAAPVIVDAMWPVLAQVWEEGYGDAYDDAHDLSRLHPTINPYGEVSA